MVAPSDSDESRTHSPRGEPSEASGGPKGPPPPMPVSAKGSPPSEAVAGRGAPSGPPPPTPASIMEPPSLGVNPSNGGAVLSATVGEGGVTPPKRGVTPPTIAPNLVPHAKTGTATVAHPGTGEVNITRGVTPPVIEALRITRSHNETFSHGLASPIVLLIVLKTFIEDNRRWRYAIRGEKHAVLATVEDNSLSHGMSGINCYHHSGILTEA